MKEKDSQEKVYPNPKLRDQALELENVYETSPVGLCFMDRDLRYIRINPRLADINGKPVSEHIGRTVREVIPHLADALEPLLLGVIESGKAATNLEVEAEDREQSGLFRHWLVNYYPIKDENGVVVGVGAVVQDVTRLKKAERESREAKEKLEHRVEERTRELEEANARLRSESTERKLAQEDLSREKELLAGVIDNSPLLIGLYDQDGRFLIVNKEAEKLLGWSLKDWHEIDVLKELHPDPDIRQEAMQFMLEANGQWRDFRAHSRDGEELDFMCSAVRLPNGMGVTMGQDITERKKFEEELAKSEERYRLLLESTNVIPWEADAETWQITYVGPQALELLGYPVEEWYELDFWANHIFAEDRNEVLQFCHESTKVKEDYSFDYRMVTADNRIVWIRNIVHVVMEDGALTKLHGFMLDITERKKAEQLLRKSEERYRLLLETTNIIPWETDGVGQQIAYVGPQIQKVLGYPLEKWYESGFWSSRIHPDDSERIEILTAEAIREGKDHEFEYRMLAADGRWLWFRNSVTIDCENGTAKTLRGVMVDITARKQIEQELQATTGKLLSAQEEERRLLARELHDDLSQQLAALAIEAGRLEQELDSCPNVVLNRFHEVVEQVGRLSDNVHSLSRQLHPSILEELGLVSAVESECRSTEEIKGVSVEFSHRNLPNDIPKDVALCLYRIVQEGLRNVSKHAGVNEARVSLHGMSDGISLAVEDEGNGFDSATVHDKVGLGLASMEERVRLFRGDFSVESSPGKGTLVLVHVPLNERKS